MQKINFEKEYILDYNVANADTGEIIAQGKKRVSSFSNDDVKVLSELLVRTLHSVDAMALNLRLRPVVTEPLISFDF